MSYWTTASGKVIRIVDLSDEHLKNIVNRFKQPTIVAYGDLDDGDVCEIEPPGSYEDCVLEAKARGLIK